MPTPDESTDIATFGAGCFWCVEAVLEQQDGLSSVRSGYMGGAGENPSYEDVCRGTTGHAEVVQVRFDPKRVSYAHLLTWFWKLHDPTTLNRQGADEGTQYRSVIFYHDAAQHEQAEASKVAMDTSDQWQDPIVTEITAAGAFWQAEGVHQEYYRLHKEQPYCRAVILPKLVKLDLDS